jgi:hypothetical protein
LATLAGTAAVPVTLVSIFGGLSRLGFGAPGSRYGWLLVVALVAAGCAGYTAFRWTFNALCERWSEEPVPPRIDRIRFRRNLVWTSS